MALFSGRCGFGSKRDVPLSLSFALGWGGNALRLAMGRERVSVVDDGVRVMVLMGRVML